MLDALFTSKIRIGLLQILLFYPEPCHVRQLARTVDAPAAAVGRELVRLENTGLLIKEKKGNMLFYRVDPRSPVLPSLKELFLQTRGAAGLIREVLRGINGVRLALLYGSMAKHSERPGSDVDVLVVGSVDERQLMMSVSRLEKTLGRAVNYVLWTESEFVEKKHKKIPLIQKIRQEKKIVLVGDAHELE